MLKRLTKRTHYICYYMVKHFRYNTRQGNWPINFVTLYVIKCYINIILSKFEKILNGVMVKCEIKK